MTTADAASRVPHDPASPHTTTQAFDWREDLLTRELVYALQRGESVETRAFVKPIFKWMKTGVRKSGQRNDVAVEKAFAFVAWMEQLKRFGDEQYAVAPQPQLDTTYALNTIVTSAQRASSRIEAERAVDMLKSFGYTPDVFAYTALIDVVARSHDVRSAFERYEELRASSSTSRPNLVVFLTVIRAIGFSNEIPVATCLELMDDARRDGIFDDSLYVRTIELCAKRRDGAVATQILQQLCRANVDWRNQQPILRALQRVLQRIENADDVLQSWLTQGLITEADVEAIKVVTSMTLMLYKRGASALGCARHVSESARLAVMHHAIDRLLERHLEGSTIATTEFETLIHQCRKRKRKDDVVVILDAMREIAAHGWTIGRESLDGEIVVAPQAQLAPNSATYAAVVETFLACNEAAQAWDTFLDATTKDFVRDQLLYRKYLRGSCLRMDPTHVVELVRFAREDGVVFSARMLSDIAKMHGKNHAQGIDVVLHQLPLLTHETKHALLQEIAVSSAASENTQGVRASIHAILSQGLPRTAATDLAVLECCLRCASVVDSLTLLRAFQADNLLLDSPVYASLVREILFKCTRTRAIASSRHEQGSTKPSESLRPALKMLHLRRGFVERLAQLQHELSDSGIDDRTPLKETAYNSNEAAIRYWVSHPSEHAPLLFLQHFVEATATVLDKTHRAATTDAIQNAVASTAHAVQFMVRAVCALPDLSLPYRAQSKIAKQLFSLVLPIPAVDPITLDLCFDQLDRLSIHVVKELDDALNLVDRPGGLSRVLAFCEQALLARGNNTEKIVAFLLSRPALCSRESAAVLVPTLAQLFVTENDAFVLQYFKSSCRTGSNQLSDTTETELIEARAMFIREVIRLEEAALTDERDMRCARRVIVEFKLEHEAEFLSLLLAHSVQFTPTNELNGVVRPSTAKNHKYLALPLPLSHVIVVDDDDSLQFAYEVLLYDGSVTRIALDAEWRPLSHATAATASGAVRPCALLQIACASHVFLFDLLALALDDLEELLAFLFENAAILKLGFRLDGDLERLRLAFPDATCFDADELQNVLDLSTTQTTSHKGLSALVEHELGLPLDKTQQCSDWEQRPLSTQQIVYAALDAYCLLLLHEQQTKTNECTAT